MADAAARRPFDVDWLLAAAATLVAAIAFTLLLTGALAVRAPSDAPEIATLASSVREVRRRPSGTLVWEDLAPGASLSLGDALFVPPSSGATVHFTDGTRLELDENTFVVLEPSDTGRGTPQVRVDKGNVIAATGANSPVQIETSAGVTRIETGSQARVSLAAGGSPRVEVLQGQASLQDGTKIGAQESAVGSKEHWTKVAWPVRLGAPAPLARLYFSGDAPPPVPLQWAGAVPDGARLEVLSRGGDKVLDEAAGTATTAAAFAVSEPGSYDWHLVGADGKPLSETRRFIVVRDVPPTLTSPRTRELIPGYLGRKVPFAWTPVPGVRHYALEVADGPEFSRIVFRQEVTGTSLRVKWPAGEGQFFWRVRSQVPDERGDSPWALPDEFRYLEKPLPDAPSIIDSTLEVEP